MDRAPRSLVFGLPAALCAAWTVYAGKDLNWDLLNYHYYLPYELLGARLQQDFFAASAQSYLNPVGYVPFYAMVAAGWHSVAVSVVLALAHAVSLSLLVSLAWRLFEPLPRAERRAMALLGAALGAASGVFWPMVGTSFLDPLLAPLVLAGVLVLLTREAAAPAALAGALLGAAAALKYSNAIYLVAALPLVVSIRSGVAYIGGAALALAVLAGPWLVALWREFGNPVFPLWNAWFRSPDALPVNLVSERFTPQGLADALGVPLRMAALDRHLYSETFAPDLRLAALAAAALALPFAARRAAAGAPLARLDARLLGFFALALALWLMTSANARYGLALLLLAGLLLARLFERLLGGRRALPVLVVLLVVQLASLVIAAPARWFLSEPWSRRWLPYVATERARTEPALYLSVEILPMAAVAPFLHPASSFVNFRGQHSLPSGSARLARLRERYGGRVRALGRRLELVGGRPAPAEVRFYDDALRRIELRVDPGDCFTVAWRPERGDLLSRAANALSAAEPAAEPLSVVSCALVRAPRDPADAAREREMSRVFDRIERRCPGLLRGQSAVTEPFGGGWSRHYNGLDARLEAFGDRVQLDRYRSATVIDLGRVADWAEGKAPPCGG